MFNITFLITFIEVYKYLVQTCNPVMFDQVKVRCYVPTDKMQFDTPANLLRKAKRVKATTDRSTKYSLLSSQVRLEIILSRLCSDSLYHRFYILKGIMDDNLHSFFKKIRH